MFRYFLHAVEGLVDFLVAFEAEGDGDDADGQDAHALGLAGNDGGCTRTRTAAHTSGDEHHLGAVVEHGPDLLHALLGGLAGALGAVAGTETFVAELEACGHGAVGEGLAVGVAHDEVHVVDAFAVHVVHGVAAATAHADDLDDGGRCGGRT